MVDRTTTSRDGVASSDMPSSTTALWAIRLLAIAYSIAFLTAGLRPGPRLWGIHAIGFLPLQWALPLATLLIAGVALLFRRSKVALVSEPCPPDSAGVPSPVAQKVPVK